MSSAFPGYPAAGLEFLAQLARHNRKDWFEAHRDTYERCLKAPTVELVTALNGSLARFAPAYRVAAPAKAVSRIHRDTRFSRDKSPYKTEVSVVLPREGKPKEESAGFYFAVSADGVEVLGGTYVPGPEQLAALRRRLLTDHGKLRALIDDPALQRRMGPLEGDQLKRPPRGLPADHPADDLLRRTQLFFRAQLPAAVATTPKLLTELAARFEAMTPFVEFLDQTFDRER